jgi:inactive STAND
MSWEEFLIVQAYRKGLKQAPRDFFVRLFMDEIALDLPVKDLAAKYCVEFKTCTGHRTAIFKAFGDCDGQQHNGKLRPLYQWLKHQHEQQERQEQCRSAIPPSPAENLHQLLQRLNYGEQEEVFRRSINLSAAAFLVRIDDLAMQQWLAWRLVEQLRKQLGEEDEKPQYLMVKASNQWGAKPELFWGWLAEQMGYPSQDKEEVLEAIAEACRNRSLIFVVYRFDVLKPAAQQLLLEEFWKPLAALLAPQTQLDWGKCRLLLTAGCKHNLEVPIGGLKVLNPWKEVLAEQDMRPWLQYRPVRDLLGKSPESLEQEWLQNSSLGEPGIVLQQLGQAIGLDDGIDEMKPYWQLAA